MAPLLWYPERYNLDGNLEEIAPTTDFICPRWAWQCLPDEPGTWAFRSGAEDSTYWATAAQRYLVIGFIFKTTIFFAGFYTMTTCLSLDFSRKLCKIIFHFLLNCELLINFKILFVKYTIVIFSQKIFLSLLFPILEKETGLEWKWLDNNYSCEMCRLKEKLSGLAEYFSNNL